MSTAQLEFENRHKDLSTLVEAYLPPAMTITVVSTSDLASGQLVLHHPAYDKQEVARRLRICADIIASAAA